MIFFGLAFQRVASAFQDFFAGGPTPRSVNGRKKNKRLPTKQKKPHSSILTMIAPITGKFRKLLIKDLAISFTLGGIGGAAWWQLYHLPNVARRDAFYAKLEASKAQ